MSHATPSQLITFRELHRRLPLSREWLVAEIRAGRLPHLKAGRTLLFNFEAVKTALAERAAQRPDADN
ncbi:MAG: hypothetical protein H6809_04900 [Phycisphaeraceae bacterium]|nr:hypothetical protein [Phycisphaeraceae bacterium]